MNYQITLILCGVSFLLALSIEAMFIPRILLISFKKHLYDLPDPRKSHISPTPRLAGVTFFPVILLSILPAISFICSPINPLGDMSYYMTTAPLQWTNIICGTIILFVLGLKDDLIGVRYSHKFLLQILAAIMFVFSGHRVDSLHGLFGIEALPSVVSIPLTILLIVYIINSINLIDGVDGLAGTLAIIACVIAGLLALNAGELIYALLAFSTCGLLVTFLYYNIFAHRKIFMGDTGSTTLGYLLALFAIHYFQKPDGTDTFIHLNAPVIAWSILFVPLADTFHVICTRIRRRHPLFTPDCNHIHHSLLRLGFRHSDISHTLGCYSLIVITSNVLLHELFGSFTLVFCTDIIIAIIVYTLLSAQIKKENSCPPPSKVRLGDYTLSTCHIPYIWSKQTVINTLNPHSWVTAKTDLHFRRALLQSDCLIPDGTGIVLGIRLICGLQISKIAGADLHRKYLEYLEETHGSVFYMGCSPQVLQCIQARIHNEYPNIRVGCYSPPYRHRFSDEESRLMVEAVNSFSPDVLFVGMTAPKQEMWIFDHRHELNARVISGIGAVFGFYAGTTPRPPRWMIRLGLEWLGRLLQEPKRMWRRNFVSSPIFLKDIFMLMIQSKKTNKETIHQ